ncbi:MAG: NuoI/complex I 23 kDa subunit family protein [Planctomycetota bacterium]|jgi:NADH-quinone oxidoreductase subunit I
MAENGKKPGAFGRWLRVNYLTTAAQGLWITWRRLWSKKFTIEYPEKKKIPRPGYRGEHRLKKDKEGRRKCVACMMCATACPSECIYIEGGEAPWPDRDKVPVRFDIDLLKCIYCGMCEEACPCDAIELTPVYTISAYTREEKIYDMETLLSK